MPPEVCMTTIILPPDIAVPLAEEARKRGTSLEQLALDCLRNQFAAPEPPQPGGTETLADFLAGYVGTVSGTTEALSENCGRRFAAGMAEKQQQGRL